MYLHIWLTEKNPGSYEKIQLNLVVLEVFCSYSLKALISLLIDRGFD